MTNWDTIRAKLGLATVGKPVLIGLTAIIVMVAVFAGRIVIDAATATDIPIEHAENSNEQVGSEALSGDASQETSSSMLYVYVSGAVKEPGLVKLEDGSRVADAIQATGGFSKDADEESINLARKVVDGEHIQVLEEGEYAIADSKQPSSDTPATNLAYPVNINNASEQDLQSLPGIGPATASKIIEYRSANGPFMQISDITNVSGIGEKKFESIADLICI